MRYGIVGETRQSRQAPDTIPAWAIADQGKKYGKLVTQPRLESDLGNKSG